MYHHRTSLGPVELAFTDRHGGVSAAPWDSLDLARSDDDDDLGARATNHRLLMQDFAQHDELHDMHQVHGGEVAVVGSESHGEVPAADALLTARGAVTLIVRAADCVPVLLADPVARVIGAAHCGRRGLGAGVVPAAVRTMRELGAGAITAWIGPHVCGRCYEVPEAMREEVGALAPASVSTTSWGTPSLDLGAGVRAQLEVLDIEVVDVSSCTRESPDLYSYRRDGPRAGRHAGLIRLARA